MEQYDQIGARLDRLPLARFHYRIFGIISFSLLLTGFLSYSGNVVLAKLVSNGWKCRLYLGINVWLFHRLSYRWVHR